MSVNHPGRERGVVFHAYSDAEALAHAAATCWMDRLAAVPDTRQCWCVALSGGRIAFRIFQSAVTESRSRQLSWEKVEFFFSDDRWVPLDDAASNCRLAGEWLFGPLRISARAVHPIYLGHSPVFDAAQAQAELLRRTPINVAGDPVLDLVILGMGEDGHVASLFPDASPAVLGSRAVYVPVVAPKPPPDRVTLTYAALAAARDVLVVVSGPGKEAALRESLAGGSRTPLGRLIGLRHRITVLTDTGLSWP